jgi:hypothetical protein
MNVTVEKQDVEIDGLPIRYLAAGEGSPVVLLHGAGDNALDWRWVMPTLAASHRVYAPDLPGSPDSARPSADYSPGFFERFVAAFVDALDIGRATFVGNSLGGLIALQLAPWSSWTAPASGVRSTRRSRPLTFRASVKPRYPSGGHQSVPTRGPGGGRRCSSLTPQKRPTRMVGRTVQAGALAGLFRSPLDCAPRLSGPWKSARGPSGSAPPLEDPDARRVGSPRPGVPAVAGKGGGRATP